MANHGAFAVGDSLDEAFDRVTELERACAAYVVVKRPREGSHMPADPDAPWDPACLQPAALARRQRRRGCPRPLHRALLDPAPAAAARARRPRPADRSTGRVARSTPKRRPRADAVLVPGRGALVFGDDHEAVAMVVEKAARAWIGAAGLGGAKPLPLWEALLMRAVYVRSYSKQAAAAHTEGPAA